MRPVQIQWQCHSVLSPYLPDADGRLAVTAGRDKVARIWDTSTGAELAALRGHDGQVRSAVFSPDGRRVLTASEDGTARLWEARPGFPVAGAQWPSILPPTFSPDGRRLYLPSPTPDYQFTARVVDTRTGAVIARTAGVNWWSAEPARFSPDGRFLLTSPVDERDYTPPSVRLLRMAPPLQPQGAAVHAAWLELMSAFYFTVANPGRDVYVLDAGTLQRRAVLRGHDLPVRFMAFGPDGRTVATADGKGRIWETRTGRLLRLLPADTDHPIDAAAFGPGSRRVATWATNHGRNFPSEQGIDSNGRLVLQPAPWAAVRIWDVATGKQSAILEGHASEVNAVAFSPDGARAVTASADGSVRLWDAATGKERFALHGHSAGVGAAAFSPDGKLVASASEDRTARVWDAATGTLRYTLRGPDGPVRCLAWDPAGHLLLTGSDDKTVRLWELEGGRALAVLTGAGPVRSARFSSDGAHVLAVFSVASQGQGRSVARTWPVDPLAEALRRRPRGLTDDERGLFEVRGK
jgi:WD40 repeat protein